jgi:hypothetical protein
LGAKILATISFEPPGGKPTTMVMDLFGYSCADAALIFNIPERAIRKAARKFCVHLLKEGLQMCFMRNS